MHGINKESRKFIENNLITIKNGFINDGLIDFVFNVDFHTFNEVKLYHQFDQVYL